MLLELQPGKGVTLLSGTSRSLVTAAGNGDSAWPIMLCRTCWAKSLDAGEIGVMGVMGDMSDMGEAGDWGNGGSAPSSFSSISRVVRMLDV